MVENRRNLNTFIAAIRSVLEDSSFEIKSPVAIEARKAAVDLLAWCSKESNVEIHHCFDKGFDSTDSFI